MNRWTNARDAISALAYSWRNGCDGFRMDGLGHIVVAGADG
jgi:hypothetical protein